MQYSRRECLLRAGSLAAIARGWRARGAESPDKYPRNLKRADIERWMTELSNWGRWGKDDQAGTINLITPAKRKQAAALVKDGVSVSMSLKADLPAEGEVPPPAISGAPGARSARPRYTWDHTMRSTGIGRTEGFAIDTISTSFHGSATTHMDALSHFFYDGKLFNGFPAGTINDWGATKDNVLAFENGIFTRGVLIDVPMVRSALYLDDDQAVYPDDFDAFEKKSGVKIEAGDAVFVRTGRWRRIAEKGPFRNQKMPGMYASCVKWLKQHDVALLGSDGVQDVRPSGVEGVDQPVHQLCLAAVGTPLMDNCDLEALSRAASERRRWTFCFTMAPLRIPGGTGSPANPIATF
jgi:kynurenine formamidase